MMALFELSLLFYQMTIDSAVNRNIASLLKALLTLQLGI